MIASHSFRKTLGNKCLTLGIVRKFKRWRLLRHNNNLLKERDQSQLGWEHTTQRKCTTFGIAVDTDVTVTTYKIR